MTEIFDDFLISNYYHNKRPSSFNTGTTESDHHLGLAATKTIDNSQKNIWNIANIKAAQKWSKENQIVLILPVRGMIELKQLWIDFNSMIHYHRKKADEKMVELFGITNLDAYNLLRSTYENFTKSDKQEEVISSMDVPLVEASTIKKYRKSISGSFTQLTQFLLEGSMFNNIYEDFIFSNTISDTLEDFNDVSSTVPTELPFGDLPYFTPDQMIDLGISSANPEDNYYGVAADNTALNSDVTVESWFNAYKKANIGFYQELSSLTPDWVQKVRELTYGLQFLKEEKHIAARKQSILELGWNPEIEFTNQARRLSRELTANRMIDTTPVRMIDLREFNVDESLVNILNEKEEVPFLLKPIYIVLIEGSSLFSAAIKTVTSSVYSHSAIAFDPELREMYSYNINNANGLKGGFNIEDIRNLKSGNRLGVFTFFVPDSVYNKVKKFITNLKKNVSMTSYSFDGLLSVLFSIPNDNDTRFICSQFVDKCLKLANVDITNKNSALVTPADLRASIDKNKKEKRIYNIYEGTVSKYKASRTASLVNMLLKKDKSLKELRESSCPFNNEREYISNILENINNLNILIEINAYVDIVQDIRIRRVLEEVLFDSLTIKPYCEIKEFPIQFDKEGNLLIKNLKKIDYEAEYAKSHKLLVEYESMDNLEGMKYELSKLFMMSCMLEEKLNSKNKSKVSLNRDEVLKARAKILNDFKYYLKVVQKLEPDFNFTEYYEESPFSSATTKINYTTMAFMTKMIKQFLKPI